MTTEVSYTLEPVTDRAGLKRFIAAPRAVYAGDPAWVPPLDLERRDALSPKHPFFEHAEWQGWVLMHAGRPVGRISAQVDALHQAHHGDATGYFGMLDAPDDPAAFAMLFEAAESWLRQRGMRRAVGPFNLGINQELGLLVEGFDTPPFFMMAHGRPYFAAAVEANGYAGVKDLLAYEVPPAFEVPKVMDALCQRLRRRVVLRGIDRGKLDAELEVMRDIFNDAWSENWGFVPFTEAEFNAVGRELMMWIRKDFIRIVEVEGETAGFIVMLPNINEAIADLGGRLFPFRWAKLLWRLKVRHPSTARVPLMGVRKRYHHTQLGPGLAFLLIDEMRRAAIAQGVRSVELSWILEDNMGMRNIIDSIGGVVTKRYRMYAKSL